MEHDPEVLRRMMERFDRQIRRAGVKRTPQRIGIFREVARTGAHPDIVTVYRNVRRAMPTVSLDTVYRTLGLFMKLGLVTTLRPLNERVRFDANTGLHHHFVCTRCGATLDFEYGAFDGLPVARAAAALGRIESRRVELRGLCAACLSKKPGRVSRGGKATKAKRRDSHG